MSYLSEAQKAKFFKIREALDDFIFQIADIPEKVNKYSDTVRVWKPGAYAIGDVRSEDGIPYKCVQAHDSTANESWKPSIAASLWMQYHGTTPDTARAWVAPTGAHDMYLVGEYMIWTDGTVYLCKQNTIYSPDVYATAWEAVQI